MVVILLFALSACSTAAGTATPTLQATELPSPQVYTTQRPKAETIARAYLDGWKAETYEKMYGLLSQKSQQSISEEKFTQRYQDVAGEATLSGIDYEILASNEAGGDTAQVDYQAILHSSIIGDIQRDLTMDLQLENGQWRVIWDDALILPELAGGNYLSMDREVPPRATIYDRNGNPLAAQHDAVAIGLLPDYVNFGEAKGLLTQLTTITGIRADRIINMVENAFPGAYLPLAQVPADLDPNRVDSLSNYGAVVTSAYSQRLYYDRGIAPHVIGYVSAIQEDESQEYRRKGYRNDERVGRKGIEFWEDSILSGDRGGTLYVFSPDGTLVGELGKKPSQPGQDIYTTIDRDLQREAQKALSIYNGAIVVLERDTGRVLAMVSTPGFDPNAYETDNYNWNTLLDGILNNPSTPLFNRAAEGQYPLGSVFKIITMAAALESGRFTTESTYDCGYVFEELPGFPRYDWTWDHFQEDGETQPSGVLTLPQGLIRSCNPYFWHMGLDLYNAGLTTAISDMARSFGLGSRTGIRGISEEAGNIPDPQSPVDATNLAVGQGDMLVTPLQVARFIAAR
jgi:penicillin-binding protein 2